MTSPEALAAALGPERALLPDARDLGADQRFVLWLVAERRQDWAEFDLWECANGHPRATKPGLSVLDVRCDRGCPTIRRVAQVRRKEAAEGD